MAKTDAERLDRCKQFANSEDIDWLVKKVREFESKLGYMTHRRDELVEQVKELETIKVGQMVVIGGLRNKNMRLREAIKQALEKHKWNNEESARILEQALEEVPE